MNKRIIQETIEEVSPHTFDCTLDDVKKMIDGWIKEHGPNAYLDWDPDHWREYDSGPSPIFYLRVEREETDEEREEALAEIQRKAQERTDRDRAEYMRLKEKFGE
jgi:hypothetical protein